MCTFWLQECHLWCPFWFSKFIVSDTVISVDCCAAQWAAGECRRLDRHFRFFKCVRDLLMGLQKRLIEPHRYIGLA